MEAPSDCFSCKSENKMKLQNEGRVFSHSFARIAQKLGVGIDFKEVRNTL